MPPLSNRDLLFVLKTELQQSKIKLSSTQIKQILKYSKGFGGRVRDVCQQLNSGMTFNKIINISKKERYEKAGIEKIFTKTEFLIYKKLVENEQKVISKDELASIINPQSSGGGVSNEAIDQTIARIRKKLKKYKIEKSIITKHGIGFYTN